jgi:Uma2 family endonuclease
MPSPEAFESPDPLVVIEVLSPTPSSMRREMQTKLMGYALVPSIAHYVVIDPHDRVVFRFRREGSQLVAAEELAEGTLRLDPPGLEIAVEDLLAAQPDTA